MFRVGALMTVAAAAAPWSSEEASWGSEQALEEEANGSQGRQLLFGRRRTRFLFAKVEAAGEKKFRAYVSVKQRRGKASWTVTIGKGSPALTAEYDDVVQDCVKYNWHIHAGPVSTKLGGDGTCGGTGGHTDNDLSCGGATDEVDACNAKFDCAADKGGCYADNYKARCSTESQKGCEFGDLSGKMGQIQLSGRQHFTDRKLEPLSTYKNLALVLHCCNAAGNCKPRVACGDLKAFR